jgi:ATP-binding cassette subfamily C (CFTR/MRP) protein 4
MNASRLVVAEDRAVGALSLRTYLDYVKAGGYAPAVVLLLMLASGEAIRITMDWWLANWSRQTAGEQAKKYYIWSLFLLALATVLVCIGRALLHFLLSLKISQTLHDRMFSRTLHAPMLFFHSNPSGRILNRFSKDISFLDELLPFTMFDFLQTAFVVLGAVVIMAVGIVWVLLIVAPLLVYFVWVRGMYVSAAREIKRVEAISRSPIFAQFSATLSGLTTIRAFHVERDFSQAFLQKLDENGRGFFSFLACARWVGVRVDGISSMLLVVCVFVAAITKGKIAAALVGLAISYSLQLAGLFQWCVRQSAEVESQMTSVERVLEYASLESEAPPVVAGEKLPPNWPAEGAISFKGLTMRYRKDLDPVLTGLTVDIPARQKVGIVGRTGAGKSSILYSLFRLVEASEGALLIDGVDVSKIGIKTLRSALSIIPQDPIIFSGTIRYNLDPFKLASDADLWRVLEIVQLKAFVADMTNKLETVVSEDGGNLSVGQRQLMCLARAILRKSRILVMDEATANVDLETDAVIQRIIRSEFKDCTMLIIAHRMATIMDADRILVLEKGQVLEYDTPRNLLSRRSHFSNMVDETGLESSKSLRKLVK